MDLLNTLKDRAAVLDPEAFATRNEGYYLFGRFPPATADEWSFTTDVRAFDFGMSPARPAASQASTPSVRFLYRVEKSDRNTWKRRISVGRATNNDVILRHDSVSKLHAHFHFGTQVRLDLEHSADLMLSDVGSANGTRVNGRGLREGDPTSVLNGDRIEFGDISCEFVNAAGLYNLLRALRA